MQNFEDMNIKSLSLIYVYVISIGCVVICEHDEKLLHSSLPKFDIQSFLQTGNKMYVDFQNQAQGHHNFS